MPKRVSMITIDGNALKGYLLGHGRNEAQDDWFVSKYVDIFTLLSSQNYIYNRVSILCKILSGQ